MKLATTALFSFALLSAVACQQGSDSGAAADPTGILLLEVTDAPMDLSIITSVIVGIDQVLIHRQADGESGFIELYDGAPLEYELSNLRNGVTSALAQMKMEPGSYSQLRVRMTGGHLTLEDGRVFSTEDGSLKFTSQDTSGMKFFMDPPIEVVEGKQTSVLLDFLLHNTFSPIPANDIENARSFKFHPNVRVAVRNNSGDVDGVVLHDDGNGQRVPLAGALVHIVAPGEIDPDQSIATTITEADGSACFLGIAPGTYDLIVEFEGRSVRHASITVSAESLTSFSIDLE